jgi:hypothetical protein
MTGALKVRCTVRQKWNCMQQRNGLHSSINQKGNINHFKKQNVAIMQARETEAASATTTYSGTVEHTGQSSAGVGRGVQTVLPNQKIIGPICRDPMGWECAHRH